MIDPASKNRMIANRELRERIRKATTSADVADEVMQAIVCALMFGNDAGLAALYDSRVVDHLTGTMYLGGGTIVKLSPKAIELLEAAHVVAQVYEGYADYLGYGINEYDLTVRP